MKIFIRNKPLYYLVSGAGLRLFLGLLPLVVLAQSPEAVEILARSGGPLLDANSFEITGTRWTETITPAGRPPRHGTFSLAFASGGRYRRTSTEVSTLEVEVSDGATGWAFSLPANTWRLTPVTRPPSLDRELAVLRQGRNRADILAASVEKETWLEQNGRLTPCYLVNATYHGTATALGATSRSRIVWIAKDSNLVLRDSWETTTLAPSGEVTRNREVVDYLTVKIDAPFSPDTFRFAPPVGSRQAMSGISGSADLNAPPVLISAVDPSYPEAAKAAGLQGTVALYVEVAPDGATTDVEVIQGLGLGLDEAAVDAVRQWRYKPSAAGEQAPVKGISVEIPFHQSPTQWHVWSAVYTVDRANPPQPEVLVKPFLTRFVAPSAACPTDVPVTEVTFSISEAGEPFAIKGAPATLGDAIKAWRYQPATSNNASARISHGKLELRCGSASLPSTEPPYRVGGGTSAPSVLSRVDPEYSEPARRAKHQGTVLLSVTIDPTGHASAMRVLRMLGMGLDQKAMEAVRQWRFKPGMKDGKPVSVTAQIEINFRLL